ncbi:hypothetical protein ACFL59_03715 [Planctomycetota bacterium]
MGLAQLLDSKDIPQTPPTGLSAGPLGGLLGRQGGFLADDTFNDAVASRSSLRLKWLGDPTQYSTVYVFDTDRKCEQFIAFYPHHFRISKGNCF